jgi:putative ABC transport system permease protein
MMNPFVMVKADYRSMRGSAWAIILLVACAVAIGVALSAQEKAVRQSATHAAADFDLVVGAAGSATQLVMTTIYLQPEALPLLSGQTLKAVQEDKRIKAFSPMAFGDVVAGYPLIGTTQSFVTRWGRFTSAAEGRFFTAENEAVIGSDVQLQVGHAITPSHGMAGEQTRFGDISAQEQAHRHADVHITIVGRLPRTGTPWDKAILIPIESVWETHGLGNGHQKDGAIGPPFDAEDIPPVPALVIKASSISNAYLLRGDYRKNNVMALFPAEILVKLYQTMGNVRDVLLVATVLNSLLILASIILLVLAIFSLRRKRYAVLRALGAPALYIGLVAWLGAFGLIAAGCAGGLFLGWALTALVSLWLSAQTGLALDLVFDWQQIGPACFMLLGGSLFALFPAWLSYRLPVHEGLRQL